MAPPIDSQPPSMNNDQLLSMFESLNLGNPTVNSSSLSNNYLGRRLPFTQPPPVPPSYSHANHFLYNVPINNLQISNNLPVFSLQRQAHNPLIDDKLQDLIENYSVQSTFELKNIVLDISLNLSSLHRSACDRNGSRILRKLIRRLKRSSSAMSCLTRALALEFRNIACNSSGRHVIKECFKELHVNDNKGLYDEMYRNCIDLATDPYGCILLNECLPYMSDFYKNGILEQIVDRCSLLAEDPYGTYVVQNALSDPKYTRSIVERLRGMISSLATQKEGSHLVEKCLLYSSTKRIVIEELLRLSNAELCYLACHKFGNFVIQKAVFSEVGEESLDVQWLTLKLQQVLHVVLKDLQSHPIGKNVYRRLYTKCHY